MSATGSPPVPHGPGRAVARAAPGHAFVPRPHHPLAGARRPVTQHAEEAA
jgi:hypothetical protein